MRREILEFETYCIRKVANQLNISQREVYASLKKSGILYDYIVSSYDVLHTFGSRYLTANLIEEWGADLHCRNDKYLATVIRDEVQEST